MSSGPAPKAQKQAGYIAAVYCLFSDAKKLLQNGGVHIAALGFGGAVAVERCTGISRRAISVGSEELGRVSLTSQERRSGRVRKPGGGRKRNTDKHPELLATLLALVEPSTRGDPESPLRWTSKSVRHLSEALKAKGLPASHQLVAELLEQEGYYSLQANVKTREGGAHPDRNAQFEQINTRIRSVQAEGQPVISVDTKKKELVGDFKNSGREWYPKSHPEAVRVHDFVIPELGRVSPYGVYDLAHNQGWVSVGTDHDTAAFAVSTIRRWWESAGKTLYPDAHRLLITADGGGTTDHGIGCGKANFRAWPMPPA